MKLLLIEDHPKIRESIMNYFTEKSFLIESSFNGSEALEKIGSIHYDVIILDVNMPIMDGREFMKVIRKKWIKTPIIVLTSNSMLDDKLEMFSLWCDDYLTKPFELKELLVRVNVLSKRKGDIQDEEIYISIDSSIITINTAKHQVYLWSELILLWRKEYLILEYLARNKWYPKNKNQILQAAWWESEESLYIGSWTLEVHISYIRSKLWKHIIKTIRWVGYLIE